MRETWHVTTTGPVSDLARYAYVGGLLARVEYLKNNDPAQGYATAQVQFNWHGDAVMAIGPDGYGYTKPQTRIGPATFDPWGATAYGDDPPPWPNYGWNAAWGYLWFSDLGLYYVHGRWYSPDMGRFIEPDGNGSYIYYGDDGINHPRGAPPVNQSVPSECLGGNTNFDARDLTCWLYREMKANLRDPRVAEIRRLLSIANQTLRDTIWIRAFGVQPYLAAKDRWYDLVADRHTWDFKHKIDQYLGQGITLCGGDRCQPNIEYTVPGNIHYGFIGRQAGYSTFELQAGAAWAEANDPAHSPN